MITKDPAEKISVLDMDVAAALVNDTGKSTVGQTKMLAEGVDFFYGDFQALTGISLTVAQNEIVALIGPSGCGKSTFLRSLNRMNDLIAGARLTGRVLIDGQDIYSRDVDPVDLRRRVGMVFQKPNPFPKSIFDNVAYGPRIHGIKDKGQLESIVERSLQQAALWDEVKDKLKQSALALSGGQQQRLCIARTLAVEPEIVLMDEPCSALDPLSTARIEELMIHLAERYTIIIVTHNMQQAARVSSKTGFFLKGEMVEFGDTRTIFGSPKDPRTADYVAGKFG